VLLAFLNESWNEMMRIFYAEVGVSSAIFYFAVATIGHMMLLRLFLAQFLEYFMQAIREEDGVDSMSQFTQSNPKAGVAWQLQREFYCSTSTGIANLNQSVQDVWKPCG
jgi:hypothetical protein